MGDWWIDDAPYPGPVSDTPTFAETFKFWRETLRAGLADAYAVGFPSARIYYFGGSIFEHSIMDEFNGEYLRKLEEKILYVPKNEDTLSVELSEMTPRERALYEKKNRSTGPRPELQFRRGNKVY